MGTIRMFSLAVAAALAGAPVCPAQDDETPRYAMATITARYLPLESVRDGTLRMPKPLSRRVTVHRQNVPLQQVLLDIATQAGLGLSYGEDLAKSGTLVSFDGTDMTAAEALAAVVHDTPWAVLVTPQGQVAVVPATRHVLGMISGRVTDRVTSAAVASAVVSLEGTRFSAVSDDSGAYRIVGVPPGTYELVVRRIGYERRARQVAVADNQTTTADILLEPAAGSLDEVIVTGVPNAVSKRTSGNAITTINVEEVTQLVSNTNVTELLQAKAPGVSVLPGGGSPGTGASIRIRGAGSLTASTAPVIYVDGVRVYTGSQGNFWNSWRSQRPGESAFGAGQDAMALDMFKPEDIASIEVIKGPAAATLYGADAANGVLQIITKKGTRGVQEMKWSAKALGGSTDWAVDRVTNYTTCTEAIQALTFTDGSPRFPGCQGQPTGTILSETSLDLPGALRTGSVRTYGVSVRGGGEGHSYFATADRDEEEGVFLNSQNERTSARANFALFPREDVDISVTMGYSRTHTQFPINDDGYGLIQAAMLYRPGFAPTVGPDRQVGFDGGNGPDRINQWDNHLRASRTTLGATLHYRPFGWLTNRLTVGLDRADRLADKYLPPGSLWSGGGQAERGAPQNSLLSVDYAGTVTTSLTPDFSSAFSAGAQYTSNQYRNTIARGLGFASSTTRQVALAATTESFSEYVDQKSLGLYVQEQIGWKDRLYLTGAVRVDNNSVFGDDIRQLYYPKLSAAYVISEEPAFARLTSWIDELKLRAAWGQAGNAPAPFAGQRSFTSGPTLNDLGVRVPALRTNAFGNPEIKPERGSELEIGADASFWGQRIMFDVTYYRKTTKDALMAVPVPASTGFPGARFENLGEIFNTGVEMSLSATPILRDRVMWEARLAMATNKNRLVSFGYDRDPITLSLYQPVQRHQPGYPLGSYWANFPLRDANGELVRNDVGALVADTQVFVGPSTPTREFSFANTVTLFGSVRLFALLDYKGGHYLYNVKDQWRCHGQPLATTWNADPAQRIPGQCWDVNDPGASDEYKEIRQQDPSINNGLFIQKADFIKLRDISLSYSLPSRWVNRLGTDWATLTVAAHNVGFLWKPHYTGPDPEVNFTGVNDPGGQFAFIRVDSWTAPMTRRFTAAIEFGF